MENETIEEAVGFIEAATGNIREALKADRPRDGITLRELIQLMERGQGVTVKTVKDGMYWRTWFTIETEMINGVKIKKAAVLDKMESIMSAKVKVVVPSSDEWIVEVEGGL